MILNAKRGKISTEMTYSKGPVITVASARVKFCSQLSYQIRFFSNYQKFADLSRELQVEEKKGAIWCDPTSPARGLKCVIAPVSGQLQLPLRGDQNLAEVKTDSVTRFSTGFFSWINFPQAPEYTKRAVSSFFNNSRRYSQLKVHHKCRWHRWQMEKIFNHKSFNYFVWTPLGSRTNL